MLKPGSADGEPGPAKHWHPACSCPFDQTSSYPTWFNINTPELDHLGHLTGSCHSQHSTHDIIPIRKGQKGRGPFCRSEVKYQLTLTSTSKRPWWRTNSRLSKCWTLLEGDHFQMTFEVKKNIYILLLLLIIILINNNKLTQPNFRTRKLLGHPLSPPPHKPTTQR